MNNRKGKKGKKESQVEKVLLQKKKEKRKEVMQWKKGESEVKHGIEGETCKVWSARPLPHIFYTLPLYHFHTHFLYFLRTQFVSSKCQQPISLQCSVLKLHGLVENVRWLFLYNISISSFFISLKLSSLKGLERKCGFPAFDTRRI